MFVHFFSLLYIGNQESRTTQNNNVQQNI